MTIHHHPGHHPSDETLVSYAAGGLSEGFGLLVASHLALCPMCRARCRSAEAIGGHLLDCAEAAPLDPFAFETLMARIAGESRPPPAPFAKTSLTAPVPRLPQPLRAYAGGDLEELPWRRLGLTASRVPIRTADPATNVQLMRFPPGLEIPRHSHGGAEMMLVLFGSLHDGDKVYLRGDLAEADESVDHTPKAGAASGCVCLAATDAPVRFHSLALRLAGPLLGV